MIMIIRKYSDLVRAKRKLIQAEIEWLRYSKPTIVPMNISIENLHYLEQMFETKKYRRLCWLDISYRARYNYLCQLQQIESFDGQSLIAPICQAKIDRLEWRRRLSMIPFVPNIAFDITFDNYMSSLECKNLAEQLIRIIRQNRQEFKTNWFNLHITGLLQSQSTRNFLDQYFDSSHRHNYPNVFFHNQSFDNLFPHEQIIYLSPHASETIDPLTIDPDTIFIIGGIVDRRKIIELTVSKCKKLGLKTKRLPLDLSDRKQIKSLDDVFRMIFTMINNQK